MEYTKFTSMIQVPFQGFQLWSLHFAWHFETCSEYFVAQTSGGGGPSKDKTELGP